MTDILIVVGPRGAAPQAWDVRTPTPIAVGIPTPLEFAANVTGIQAWVHSARIGRATFVVRTFREIHDSRPFEDRRPFSARRFVDRLEPRRGSPAPAARADRTAKTPTDSQNRRRQRPELATMPVCIARDAQVVDSICGRRSQPRRLVTLRRLAPRRQSRRTGVSRTVNCQSAERTVAVASLAAIAWNRSSSVTGFTRWASKPASACGRDPAAGPSR